RGDPRDAECPVKVAAWSDRAEVVAQRLLARYDSRDHHHQVQGADLGISAAAHLAARDLPLELAEDRALASSLAQTRALRTARIRSPPAAGYRPGFKVRLPVI
ncbi:MAG: hypothetical protein ACLQNU_04825, partial [Candidatus Dormibacteria bacterium]